MNKQQAIELAQENSSLAYKAAQEFNASLVQLLDLEVERSGESKVPTDDGDLFLDPRSFTSDTDYFKYFEKNERGFWKGYTADGGDINIADMFHVSKHQLMKMLIERLK